MARQTGTVKFFNSSKGFGFISPEGGGKDVFVHASAIEMAGMSVLSEGQRVSFDIQPDAKGAKAFNEKLERLWPDLKQELAQFMIPAEEMERLLRAAGGATTARELGLSPDFYREAALHCREMRNRFSFLDIAADARILADFVAHEA